MRTISAARDLRMKGSMTRVNRLPTSGVARHDEKEALRRAASRARACPGTPSWRRSTRPLGRKSPSPLRSLIPPSLDDNETETLSQRPFQPDIILASQFFGRLRRQALSGEPERELLIAVLEDGVACFQKYLLANRPPDCRLFKDAQDWIMSEDTPRNKDERPALSFKLCVRSSVLIPAICAMVSGGGKSGDLPIAVHWSAVRLLRLAKPL
jgi:hypothetical protein